MARASASVDVSFETCFSILSSAAGIPGVAGVLSVFGVSALGVPAVAFFQRISSM